MASLVRQGRQSFLGAGCIFLDCDGVVFDSNGFKQEALRHALAGHPEAAIAEMERYWVANGGVGRYEKLEHFFRVILASSERSIPELVTAAADRFGAFCRRAYEQRPPVSEALQLARVAGKERCFVVSGADQAELHDVFRAKGISELFAEICGSPVSKAAHVERILQARGCPPSKALFIGDGGGDFRVCQSLGLPFIYLHQFSEWTSAKAELRDARDVLVFDAWSQVLDHLGVADEHD